MLVYYTVEKKVRVKTAVVSLWFDVAQLTDSLLEVIKVCQGDNGGRETIPLNNCQGKKSVFVVVSPRVNLSVRQWVGSRRDAGSRGSCTATYASL